MPGLRSPSRLLGADRHSVLGHHHVRVVALEGEGVAHGDLRFARGAHRDLGRSRKDLRAREASRAFGGGGTQGARSDQDGLAVALGAGVRDLRTVSCRIDLRDVVFKALGEIEGDDRGRRAWMLTTLPLLTISVLPPRLTCARRVSAFLRGLRRAKATDAEGALG